MKKIHLLGLILIAAGGFWTVEARGQFGESLPTPVLSGNVGVMWQSYAEDPLIGAVVPPSKTGYNAFANVLYNQGDFSAGIRYESYLNAVIGFPGRFKGTGLVTVSPVTKTVNAALT